MIFSLIIVLSLNLLSKSEYKRDTLWIFYIRQYIAESEQIMAYMKYPVLLFSLEDILHGDSKAVSWMNLLMPLLFFYFYIVWLVYNGHNQSALSGQSHFKGYVRQRAGGLSAGPVASGKVNPRVLTDHPPLILIPALSVHGAWSCHYWFLEVCL